MSEQRVYIVESGYSREPLLSRFTLEDAILDTAEYLNGAYVPDPQWDYRQYIRTGSWRLEVFSLPLQGEVLRPRCHGRFVRDFDAPHFIFQRNDGDDHAPE